MNQNRQPKGRPTGGRYATTEHAEAPGSLHVPVTDSERLAWAEGLGLPGSFSAYAGDDPNVDHPALTYTTPGGREVRLCGIGQPSMSAFWDGRGDDDAAMRTEPARGSGDPGVRDAVVDVAAYAAVQDALDGAGSLPQYGEEFELRFIDIGDGTVGLEYRAFNDDEEDEDGDEVAVGYTAGSGELTLVYNDARLEPGSAAYTAQLTRLLDDGRAAPVDPTAAAEKAKAAFRDLIDTAGADPDAPEWMRAAHRGV